MPKKTITISIVCAVTLSVAVGIFFVQQHGMSSNKTSSSANPPSSTTTHGATASPSETATITYDGDSFEPETITVVSGGTIKLINQSQENVVIVADQVAGQADNSQIAAGNIDPGVSKTITVNTAGSWKFHNQQHPTEKGAIIVQ